MKSYQFTPADTLFLRNGIPFSKGSSDQEGVASQFPPNPATLVGAFRAALARCNGWNGAGKWPEGLNSILGDGPQNLGALSFQGPFLLLNGEPLFRAPHHLIGAVGSQGGWTPKALLRPGDEVRCDLGQVRLPDLAADADEPGKPTNSHWLTGTGMASVLRGQLPDTEQIKTNQALWREEPRIGLEIQSESRTAAEGQLYSTRHARLVRGVSIGLRVQGTPTNWNLPVGQMAPIGGESRFAECTEWSGTLPLASAHPSQSVPKEFVLVALTPLDLEDAACRGAIPLDLPGRPQVVCACLDRPQRVGGWDSNARRPLPLRNLLAPGSTLFCTVDEAVKLHEAIVRGDGLLSLGEHQNFGCGLMAIGVWPDESTLASADQAERRNRSSKDSRTPKAKRGSGKRRKGRKIPKRRGRRR